MKQTLKKQYMSYLQKSLALIEVYNSLAKIESDTDRSNMFKQLSANETAHAHRLSQILESESPKLGGSKRSIQSYFIKITAKVFGTKRVIPFILKEEAKRLYEYGVNTDMEELVRDKHRNRDDLRMLSGNDDPLESLRKEGHSSALGIGGLRATVLGMNDGLVSNFCLISGIVGGTNNTDLVILAGIAGLLAGALSMATGEYISVRSQTDSYEFQIEKEKLEIEQSPEEETKELALIYESKGLTKEEANNVAEKIMSNPKIALDTMAREELGLNPSDLGSPWGASLLSFVSFGLGAFIPLVPYLIGWTTSTLLISGLLSGICLIIVGGTIGFMTGRNIIWSSSRMILAGGIAATITFTIGNLVGASLS